MFICPTLGVHTHTHTHTQHNYGFKPSSTLARCNTHVVTHEHMNTKMLSTEQRLPQVCEHGCNGGVSKVTVSPTARHFVFHPWLPMFYTANEQVQKKCEALIAPLSSRSSPFSSRSSPFSSRSSPFPASLISFSVSLSSPRRLSSGGIEIPVRGRILFILIPNTKVNFGGISNFGGNSNFASVAG